MRNERFLRRTQFRGTCPKAASKKTTSRIRPGVYFSRGHVPPLPNPNHSATALHSVLHTGAEELSGSFGDPPNSCPRKPDDRIRIRGPFQVSLLGVTRRGRSEEHTSELQSHSFISYA